MTHFIVLNNKLDGVAERSCVKNNHNTDPVMWNQKSNWMTISGSLLLSQSGSRASLNWVNALQCEDRKWGHTFPVSCTYTCS